VWYLVATSWWQSWCRYSNFNFLNGTSAGDLLFPNLPANVISHSGVGTHESSSNIEKGNIVRPGRIANWSLLHRCGSRRLKLEMVVGKDFHVSSLQ